MPKKLAPNVNSLFVRSSKLFLSIQKKMVLYLVLYPNLGDRDRSWFISRLKRSPKIMSRLKRLSICRSPKERKGSRRLMSWFWAIVKETPWFYKFGEPLNSFLCFGQSLKKWVSLGDRSKYEWRYWAISQRWKYALGDLLNVQIYFWRSPNDTQILSDRPKYKN